MIAIPKKLSRFLIKFIGRNTLVICQANIDGFFPTLFVINDHRPDMGFLQIFCRGFQSYNFGITIIIRSRFQGEA